MQFITMRRIPMSGNNGIHESKAQHDRKTGQIKTAKQRRKEVLESITHMISAQRNVDEVALAADCNEDIESEEETLTTFLLLLRVLSTQI